MDQALNPVNEFVIWRFDELSAFIDGYLRLKPQFLFAKIPVQRCTAIR